VPPTALKMMRTIEQPERWRFALRAVARGGESLGAGLTRKAISRCACPTL